MIRDLPRQAYIGLGSNLGDRARQIAMALAKVDAVEGVRVVRVSRLRETEPEGGPAGQGRYLNAVAELETRFGPEELLGVLLSVEGELGRERSERWGPRRIDLDLLLYEREVRDTAELQLPHPRLHLRGFVLEPLAEIGPEAVHPVLGRTAAELLQIKNEK